MSEVTSPLSAVAPALLFLCAGVPLAALLDRLGFFEAVAIALTRRRARVPVIGLWALAALTTAVLNLDTTIVLLTPLYIRVARRSSVDPLSLAVIPLVLASLASSVLPISNLTTLIVVDRVGLSVAQVASHLGAATVAAVVAGWFAYRRRHPASIPAGPTGEVDRGALRFGGLVVAGVLVGFVAGPSVGVAPWVVALAADAVLVVRVRTVPWREVPLSTAAAIAVLTIVVSVAVPSHPLRGLFAHSSVGAVALTALAATGLANAVNNLPAALLAAESATRPSWGLWAWLLGTNVGAVLLPWGAIANLLWWRLARADGVELDLRRYLRESWSIGAPALGAAVVVLAAQRALSR